jgi:hypothetical protein
MESMPRRVVMAIIEGLMGADGCAFGSGKAVVGHGQAWIPPRRECG